MSDSGWVNDFYRRDFARCARDWAMTKHWDVPKPLRERLLQFAEAFDVLEVASGAQDALQKERDA